MFIILGFRHTHVIKIVKLLRKLLLYVKYLHLNLLVDLGTKS